MGEEVQDTTVSSYNNMRLYRLDKLVYDAEEDLGDKLVSLYGALNSILFTVFLVLRSKKTGVELYLGTFCEGQASTAGSILQTGNLLNTTYSEKCRIHEVDTFVWFVKSRFIATVQALYHCPCCVLQIV